METIYQLIISMSFSGLFVLLSKLFYFTGSESLLVPGKILEFYLTGFILLAFPTGDDYYSLPYGSELVLNILFYALLPFLLFKAIALSLKFKQHTT